MNRPAAVLTAAVMTAAAVVILSALWWVLTKVTLTLVEAAGVLMVALAMVLAALLAPCVFRAVRRR